MSSVSTRSKDCVQQRKIAYDMIVRGYSPKIVQIETTLTYRQVSLLKKKAEENMCVCANTSRSSRSGASIIHNRVTKIEASILMLLYMKLAILNINESIDLQALEKSHDIYQSIRDEIITLYPVQMEFLTITDAWCLAKEFRSEEAMFDKCSECNTSYFTSSNQSTLIDCPFCQVSGH